MADPTDRSRTPPDPAPAQADRDGRQGQPQPGQELVGGQHRDRHPGQQVVLPEQLAGGRRGRDGQAEQEPVAVVGLGP